MISDQSGQEARQWPQAEFVAVHCACARRGLDSRDITERPFPVILTLEWTNWGSHGGGQWTGPGMGRMERMGLWGGAWGGGGHRSATGQTVP
jgi:hypothetical protein